MKLARLKRSLIAPYAALFLGASCVAGGILPLAKLDPASLSAFDQVISRYEADATQEFNKGNLLWIDQQDERRKAEIAAGRAYADALAPVNVPGGQITHLFGSVRIAGATLQTVFATMQSYSRYPEYYKPDITKGSSQESPDSTPMSKHFQVFLQLVQSTPLIDVAFETSYDTRYVMLDRNHAVGTSRSIYIREYRDAHNQNHGTLPEGDDHGFLWRTYTSWHFRERDAGVDLELNSFSLMRSVPPGLGWWASRTAKMAVEKMINQTAQAILSRSQQPLPPI